MTSTRSPRAGSAGAGSRRVAGIAVLLLSAVLTIAVAAPASAAPAVHTAPVTIATVPALPGFPVTLDGVTSRTDAAGKAHFDTPVIHKPLADRIKLTEAVVTVDGQQVKATATRLYRFTTGAELALDLSYPIDFRFSNTSGPSVTASSMNTIVVRSGTGEVRELPAHERSWLQGRRAVPKQTGLVVKNVDWSVERVMSAGSNVVNQSQQRFRPGTTTTVDVTVLFFGLDVRVDDGLFGFHLSNRVKLEYPDHSTRTFPLDRQGRAKIPPVPRGTYVLTPLGAGLTTAHPVGVSRGQTVAVQFYSWPDLLTVLVAVLLLAGALAWIGVRRRRHHEERAPDAGPQDAGTPVAAALDDGSSDRGPRGVPSPRPVDEVSADLEVSGDHTAG